MLISTFNIPFQMISCGILLNLLGTERIPMGTKKDPLGTDWEPLSLSPEGANVNLLSQ
jgi:hypothetical protein